MPSHPACHGIWQQQGHHAHYYMDQELQYQYRGSNMKSIRVKLHGYIQVLSAVSGVEIFASKIFIGLHERTYNIVKWNPHKFHARSIVFMLKFLRSTNIEAWVSLGEWFFQ
ncbi:uncharacterized protein LOC114267347 isoform X1 [Camellia sinensis]|uniref:uncharacterized protein LOC114267347 isoform X1 n=1 Tax=Camellia sinensis TaxID=4442 RepID=UPI0010356AD9|nr:uncharacterized protein LOC114267347 isoform X1 [Camellia sinensis]